MAKEVRSTIYLEEDLYKRFREACNKKFGDKQGKIKQWYVLAIGNFANEVLEDVVDIVIEMKPEPEVKAKKLDTAKPKKDFPYEEIPKTIIKTPQQVIEESRSLVDTPPISAKKLDQAKMVSVDEGLAQLMSSIQHVEAKASVQLDQDSELQTVVAKAEPTIEEVDKPEEVLEKERLDKVRRDQEWSKLQTQSTYVGENSIEAKAKRLAERRRKQEKENNLT